MHHFIIFGGTVGTKRAHSITFVNYMPRNNSKDPQSLMCDRANLLYMNSL